MTGPAFEQLLQHGNPALIETVMSSVAVFARMRGHQKGQVMDLLGRRGLYQQALCENSGQRHIPVSTSDTGTLVLLQLLFSRVIVKCAGVSVRAVPCCLDSILHVFCCRKAENAVLA